MAVIKQRLHNETFFDNHYSGSITDLKQADEVGKMAFESAGRADLEIIHPGNCCISRQKEWGGKEGLRKSDWVDLKYYLIFLAVKT